MTTFLAILVTVPMFVILALGLLGFPSRTPKEAIHHGCNLAVEAFQRNCRHEYVKADIIDVARYGRPPLPGLRGGDGAAGRHLEQDDGGYVALAAGDGGQHCIGWAGGKGRGQLEPGGDQLPVNHEGGVPPGRRHHGEHLDAEAEQFRSDEGDERRQREDPTSAT